MGREMGVRDEEDQESNFTQALVGSFNDEMGTAGRNSPAKALLLSVRGSPLNS